MILKYSFDADGCLLNNQAVEKIAIALRKSGAELFIITSRFPDERRNEEIRDTQIIYVIPDDHVYYLGGTGKTKSELILELGIAVHFDDDPYEVDEINRNNPYGVNNALLVNYRLGV